MKKENADPENPKKRRADPRQNSDTFPNHFGTKPQSGEKLGAVPAKTSKTLSSRARWPGKVFLERPRPKAYASRPRAYLRLAVNRQPGYRQDNS